MSGTTKGTPTTKVTTTTLPTKAAVVVADPPMPTDTSEIQVVTVAGYTPSSFDVWTVSGFGVFVAGDQPPFPTPWPPSPPPAPSYQSAGVVPWRKWIETLAVRPYVTDPPPCPVVVSRYPGLTTN